MQLFYKPRELKTEPWNW